ncbi:hypothetical protein GBA52_006780 [Prunus armeniaca]|nr:hypothetical protein GBA52_006780 [Prunus armeniaca]
MGLLGKFFRFLLLGHCCKPTTTGGDTESLGPHGISAATLGVWALAYDLFNFEITSQVPEDLSQHVVSSKKAQANWYRKLVETWREAKQPPRTEEEAARLVIQTLKGHKKADVQGLLDFYGLPRPHSLVKVSAGVPTSLPRGVKFEFQTLPGTECSKRGDPCSKVSNSTETLMLYGQEAKEELVKLLEGKCLRVLVYGEDRYGRGVADVYCNGIFAQEVMLKKGGAWHYTAYDQRSKFARWEEEARRRQIGLWASLNPEKPWDWRKDRRQRQMTYW